MFAQLRIQHMSTLVAVHNIAPLKPCSIAKKAVKTPHLKFFSLSQLTNATFVSCDKEGTAIPS
jgi:hypothetical protein